MKTSRNKIFVRILVIALCAFVAVRVYYRLTDDFRMGNIISDMESGPVWKTFPVSDEEKGKLFSILGQKFYYLGKGAQCYAFVSADGKFVLKFFKFKHSRPNAWLNLLPPIPIFERYKTAVEARKTRKFLSTFVGHELTFQENKEGAELIYLHFMPTRFFNRSVTVVDKIGLERHIDLDTIVFLLQNRGEVFTSRMHRILGADQLDLAKRDLASILDMYVKEYNLGLYDGDHGVTHNTGFIEDRPFHLDVGKVVKDDSMKNPENYKHDLKQVVWNMNDWIRSFYPRHYSALSPYLFDLYYKHTGSIFDPEDSIPSKCKKKKR